MKINPSSYEPVCCRAPPRGRRARARETAGAFTVTASSTRDVILCQQRHGDDTHKTANMAQIRQSKPDFGVGFLVEVFQTDTVARLRAADAPAHERLEARFAFSVLSFEL